MLEYIRAIKRGLRDTHGFIPTGGTDHDPTFDKVPDGTYPMEIDGKTDHVKITGGKISCGNFEPQN